MKYLPQHLHFRNRRFASSIFVNSSSSISTTDPNSYSMFMNLGSVMLLISFSTGIPSFSASSLCCSPGFCTWKRKRRNRRNNSAQTYWSSNVLDPEKSQKIRWEHFERYLHRTEHFHREITLFPRFKSRGNFPYFGGFYENWSYEKAKGH